MAKRDLLTEPGPLGVVAPLLAGEMPMRAEKEEEALVSLFFKGV